MCNERHDGETAVIPPELASFASRFEFTAIDFGVNLRITIERYDNHGRLIPNGGWVVACWFTSDDVPNVHYLDDAGVWRYKHGTAFKSLALSWHAYTVVGPPT